MKRQNYYEYIDVIFQKMKFALKQKKLFLFVEVSLFSFKPRIFYVHLYEILLIIKGILK